MINFIHLVVGLCGDWELLAASLDKTVLTSTCEKGIEWRTGTILGGEPIPYFQSITSTYGDLVLAYFTILLRGRTSTGFLLGQLQQAYVQTGSECVLNVKYWDSNNFNPRKPFTYTSCSNIWPPTDLPDNLTKDGKNDPYSVSFIPQMVWHAFCLDFFIFLDPNYVITHDTRKVMRRGVKLLQNRKIIGETCIKLIDKLRSTFNELFGTNLDSGENLHTIMDNKDLPLLLRTADPKLLKITINLILNWFKSTNTNISIIPLNQLEDKINSILENDITPLSVSRNIIRKAEIVMETIIIGLKINQITDELVKEICLFYNDTCGLLLNNQILRDSPILSNLICI